jgi:Beta propeller domain
MKDSKSEYESLARKVAEESVDSFVDQIVKCLDCKSMQQITLFQNTDDFHPYGQVGESIATVTGFNVKNPTVTSVTSRVMPTSYWNMYASASTLVLAAEGYWIGDEMEQETYVLAYELANAKATPVGFGKIPGYLLNQFSMDEHNGYLRFASTIRERWRWAVEGDKGVQYRSLIVTI